MKKIVVMILVLTAGLLAVRAHADPMPTVPGIREPLVLVVADVASADRAQATHDTLAQRFGALDAFRVDVTDAYDVRAALVQTAPRAVAVRCSSADEPFSAVVRSQRVTLECARGFRKVFVNQDVSLRYVPKADFATYAFPDSCGGATTTPCERDTYHRFFGSDLELPRGQAVVATGFRTREGAEQFLSFARAIGVGGLVAVQAYKWGGADIGLGQEPHPDGSGPLLSPLANQESYQR